MFPANKPSWDPLEKALVEVYVDMQPSHADSRRRRTVVETLNEVLGNVASGQEFEVAPFGSFESDLYSPWADLDLSLQLVKTARIPLSPWRKREILNRANVVLLTSDMTYNLEYLRTARIPVIKFCDKSTGVMCDISVDNIAGVLKSRVLGWICAIDERCRQLIFLVKCWAKVHNLNNPKDGTFNSFALCLLVIFHLQNVSPPILPPLTDILGDWQLMPEVFNNDRERSLFLKSCQQKIEKVKSQGNSKLNTTSLAVLFSEFFTRFDGSWDNWRLRMTVSTSSGGWRDFRNAAWIHSESLINIEDPFEQLQNCGRTVQSFAMDRIQDSFKVTAQDIRNPPKKEAIPKLRISLFQWPRGAAHPVGVKLTAGDIKFS